MMQANGFKWMEAAGAAALFRPGDGGTIAVIPGAMADAEGWVPFASSLPTSRAIAIMNRRGRAPSDALPPGSTVQDEVRDVLALLSQLQGPFVLFGWSYGGLLAMEAACRIEDVASVVLYEPVSRPFATSAIQPIADLVHDGDLDRALAKVLTEVGGTSEEQVIAMRNTPAWAYLRPLTIPAATELSALNRHEPDFGLFAAGRIPTTILVGEANLDGGAYGVATNRFIAAIPTARTRILPGQGHLAHVEAPTRLADAVGEILMSDRVL